MFKTTGFERVLSVVGLVIALLVPLIVTMSNALASVANNPGPDPQGVLWLKAIDGRSVPLEDEAGIPAGVYIAWISLANEPRVSTGKPLGVWTETITVEDELHKITIIGEPIRLELEPNTYRLSGTGVFLTCTGIECARVHQIPLSAEVTVRVR